MHNALCLWRTYIQLKKTLGNKAVNYETTGINSMNPDVLMFYDRQFRMVLQLTGKPEIRNCVSNPRPQDDTLENIATLWGFNVVDIPGKR